MEPTPEKLDEIFAKGSGANWHASPETQRLRYFGLQAVFTYGRTFINPVLKSVEQSSQAQIAGLTKGIGAFMTKNNNLHKRLQEVEGALSKRKKQNQTDSKQIDELFRDLHDVCNSIVASAMEVGVTKAKPCDFEAFKDGWLWTKGYKP